MADKPYRPKMTAAEKKAYKNRNAGLMGKTGGMGGKYGRKSENLTAKQLKASGGLAASKKRTVDIGQTSRSGGFTLGPGGKPLTGTVKLANGKTAVYKGGKRVQATLASQLKPARTSGSGTTSKPNPKPKPKIKVTRVPPSVRGEGGGGSLSTYQANRLGTEGPKYSVARATKPSYGPYESQSDRNKKSARKAAAAAAAKRNQSKPRSNGKAVPMQLRKQKDGSYRWVKVV